MIRDILTERQIAQLAKSLVEDTPNYQALVKTKKELKRLFVRMDKMEERGYDHEDMADMCQDIAGEAACLVTCVEELFC